jgi:hypothetical protein
MAETMEIALSPPSDLAADLAEWPEKRVKLAGENARLRRTSAQMLAALTAALLLLRDVLPASVGFDCAGEALAKVQHAIAEAERDA